MNAAEFDDILDNSAFPFVALDAPWANSDHRPLFGSIPVASLRYDKCPGFKIDDVSDSQWRSTNLEVQGLVNDCLPRFVDLGASCPRGPANYLLDGVYSMIINILHGALSFCFKHRKARADGGARSVVSSADLGVAHASVPPGACDVALILEAKKIAEKKIRNNFGSDFLSTPGYNLALRAYFNNDYHFLRTKWKEQKRMNWRTI